MLRLNFPFLFSDDRDDHPRRDRDHDGERAVVGHARVRGSSCNCNCGGYVPFVVEAPHKYAIRVQ